MDDRGERARRTHREIARILRDEWDPIGVGDVPEAADEYDDYVGGVYRALIEGATAGQVAEGLLRIEVEQMGLGPAGVDGGRRRAAAESLVALELGS